jgi:SNF2 family DNA or RNA helicase
MNTDFITIPLFNHQQENISNMEKLEKNPIVAIDLETSIETRLGFLSDLPGYGKSLCVLGLIGVTQFDEVEEVYFKETIEMSNLVKKTKTKCLEQVSTSLLLVNVSLLSQWITELSRTSLRYIAVYQKGDIEGIDLKKYDLILVSNNIYNTFSQVYRTKSWRRMIIDEPASLKIVSMEETNAKFYWFITATPYELYPRKRTGFINDMLPEMEWLKYIIVKNEDQYVRNSYEMPITNHIYYTITCEISKFFTEIVNHNTIEMLEAGNVSGVLTSFGNTSDNIIDSFKNRKEKRLLELKNDEEHVEKIQLIKDHLSILNERICRYVSEYSCILCNNPHQQLQILTCCQTIYCGCEIKTDSCPVCKSNEMAFSTFTIQDMPFVDEKLAISKSNTKIQQIMTIIGDSTGKKILIFSNFNESFVVIKKWLEERKILYLELRGTKEKRDNTIDSYKTGNVNVLLLNTIHSGAGLNLQETTDIIMYHRLHDYQKTQVIGRANRIGRKINLNVHYLE